MDNRTLFIVYGWKDNDLIPVQYVIPTRSEAYAIAQEMEEEGLTGIKIEEKIGKDIA
jgi:hypothetical protein